MHIASKATYVYAHTHAVHMSLTHIYAGVWSLFGVGSKFVTYTIYSCILSQPTKYIHTIHITVFISYIHYTGTGRLQFDSACMSEMDHGSSGFYCKFDHNNYCTTVY